MSVKELILKDSVGNSITVRSVGDGLFVHIKDLNKVTNAYMSRENAHLLMIYLMEHFT